MLSTAEALPAEGVATPPRHITLERFSVICFFHAISTQLVCWVEFDPNDRKASLLAMGYFFASVAFLLLGCLSLWAGRINRTANRAKAELASQLAEQAERIRKLEAQVAALTPTPKP